MNVFKLPLVTCQRLNRAQTGEYNNISNILPSRETFHVYPSFKYVTISLTFAYDEYSKFSCNKSHN